MTPLDQINVIVAVFAMPECGACEEYIPRLLVRVEEFNKSLKGHQVFVVYAPGTVLAPGAIPVLIYDVTANDPQLQQFADRFAVAATPTTVVQKQSGGVLKTEGALSNNQIDALLGLAFQHNLKHEPPPPAPAPLPVAKIHRR